MVGTPSVTEPIRIVLATTNGTGMGHLARQAAIALALPDTVEPVIFSLSQAVHVVSRHEFRAEYCPSHQRNWMPHVSWHDYLGQRVSALLTETRAKVFVFDGVAPYLGMLRIRAEHPAVAFAWVRRGMWRPGANRGALGARPFFDLVVEPGDLASSADRGATSRLTDATRVAPITVLEGASPLPRQEAAEALGLDPDRPAVLVMLGASSIATADGATLAALAPFVATSDWQVAVIRLPRALAGLPGHESARVTELADVYPLARYLAAFDAAVSAAGYNAVHELIPARIPTLFVPAARTTDDQDGRARYLATQGLALYAEDDSKRTVTKAVRKLLDPAVRAALAARCAEVATPAGASAVAEALLALADTFGGHRPSSRERIRTVNLALRANAMRALGPAGTSAVRRARGRATGSGPVRPLAVRPLVTHDLDAEVLRGDHPVEHLLRDSSPAYRTRRLAIAQEFYDWSATD